MVLTTRARRWLDRWGPILPVLVAELVILLGFGALLPVLPLYVMDQGVDAPTLGLILAAWSIAKLVAEPVFGYLADRTSRKPFLVGGALVLAVAMALPVVYHTAFALFLLRALAGAAAGAYDPAARGIIVDATPAGARGEAFGLYASFQMGGFLLGPVLGAFGASLGGGFTFPFLLCGALTAVAAVILVLALPSHPHVPTAPAEPGHAPPPVHPVLVEPPFSATTAGIPAADETPPSSARAPMRALLNRCLVASVVMNFGFSLAFGVYEVVWSLFLTDLGASIEWIGLTFALFGLGMMLVSPWAGRLVDRFGSIRFVAVSGTVIIVAGVLYAVSTEPIFPSLVVPFESVAEAFLTPALFALVAVGSPVGRSSTAQGIFGAVGTIGLIVATLSAGALWDIGRVWPFLFFVVGSTLCMLLGLAIVRSEPRASAAAETPSLAGA
jgi:DHA1 family multidrug resistance protein-like MFS transporter